MKFLAAVAVYLLISLVLCWGILLTFKGNFWVLGVAVLAYLAAFAKLGCLPSSH
jgi:hypothetical protein